MSNLNTVFLIGGVFITMVFSYVLIRPFPPKKPDFLEIEDDWGDQPIRADRSIFDNAEGRN